MPDANNSTSQSPIQPKTFLAGLFYSLGVAAYVTFIAGVMTYGGNWLGNSSGLFVPTAFLLVFVVSATIVGGLVLGHPAYLLFSGRRREALFLAGSTIACLVLETIIYIGILAFVK